MSLPTQKRARLAAAWMCLLAVALMYAPLAGAALLTAGMDCCAGGYCKVPAHHHSEQPAPEQQGSENHSAGMTCEHEMGGISLTPCKMSCCQDPSRPVLMPVAFVMPAASLMPQPSETLGAMEAIRAPEILRYAKPLSPPPRTASFSI